MPGRALTRNQKALFARNRANGAKSTGPRTVEGKAMSSWHALTQGLTAQTPRDEAAVAYRDRRIAEPAAVVAPREAFERGLVARLASAFQRRERVGELASGSFETALPIGPPSPGAILTLNARCRHVLEAIDRDRASTEQENAVCHRPSAALRRVEEDAAETWIAERTQRSIFSNPIKAVDEPRSARKAPTRRPSSSPSRRPPHWRWSWPSAAASGSAVSPAARAATSTVGPVGASPPEDALLQTDVGRITGRLGVEAASKSRPS